MKFSIKNFFSKCDQIRNFLQIWSHLLKKSLMENFMFCALLAVKPLFFARGTTFLGTAFFSPMSRSSRSDVFLRKGALKIYSKSTGEHPCRSLISIKLLCNFIEIALQHGCSSVICCILLEHLFQAHLWVAASVCHFHLS